MADPFSGFGNFNTDNLIIDQADAALRDGQIDSAISYFISLVKESEDNDAIELCHSKLAECYYKTDRWRDCIESARASLHYPDSKVYLAISLNKRGDPHMALTVLDKINSLDTLSSNVRCLLDSSITDIEDNASNKIPSIPKHVDGKVKEFKIQGNYKFKINDFKNAVKLYKNGLDVLDEWMLFVSDSKYFNSNDDFLEQFNRLYGILISNLINCHMKTDTLHECQNMCNKLIQIQPNWKKSFYWSAMCCLACFQYSEAREKISKCSNCANTNNDKIDEKLEFVSFCENNESKFKSTSLSHWQSVHTAYCKNISWLAGNLFAMSISKIYTDNTTFWHMTTSALVDNSGEITNFMAPKYEASEKDRNLINEMKQNKKKKFFIHLTQSKSDWTQKIGFTDLDNLSDIARDSLIVLECDINKKDIFNAFVKNYVK